MAGRVTRTARASGHFLPACVLPACVSRVAPVRDRAFRPTPEERYCFSFLRGPWGKSLAATEVFRALDHFCDPAHPVAAWMGFPCCWELDSPATGAGHNRGDHQSGDGPTHHLGRVCSSAEDSCPSNIGACSSLWVSSRRVLARGFRSNPVFRQTTPKFVTRMQRANPSTSGASKLP